MPHQGPCAMSLIWGKGKGAEAGGAAAERGDPGPGLCGGGQIDRSWLQTSVASAGVDDNRICICDCCGHCCACSPKGSGCRPSSLKQSRSCRCNGMAAVPAAAAPAHRRGAATGAWPWLLLRLRQAGSAVFDAQAKASRAMTAASSTYTDFMRKMTTFMAKDPNHQLMVQVTEHGNVEKLELQASCLSSGSVVYLFLALCDSDT